MHFGKFFIFIIKILFLRWNFEKNGNNEQLCKILLNNELVASASGETQKKAKELAATAAIEKLQESCYTVKVNMKKNFYSSWQKF